MADEIAAYPDPAETIEVLIHSNRFGRSFRVRAPTEAKPSYLLDKDLGEQVFRHLYHVRIDQLCDGIRQSRKRAFSSAEIGRIASRFFAHVDA